MRRFLFLPLALICIACGGMPNTQATQTRTSEIVELTVAARTLPTQNAAVPPTPVPAPPTPVPITATPPPASATARATLPTDTYQPIAFPPPLINGSWVAYSPVIHTRFFAPPSLVEDFDLSNNHRYSLSSPSNVFDFEALDIYRFAGAKARIRRPSRLTATAGSCTTCRN